MFMSLWWRFSSFPVETVLSQYTGSVIISRTKQLNNHCQDLKRSCGSTGILRTTVFFAGHKHSLSPLLRLSACSLIPRKLFTALRRMNRTQCNHRCLLPSQKRYIPIFQIPQSFINRLLVWKGCQLQQPKTQQCRPQHSKLPSITLSMHKAM